MKWAVKKDDHIFYDLHFKWRKGWLPGCASTKGWLCGCCIVRNKSHEAQVFNGFLHASSGLKHVVQTNKSLCNDPVARSPNHQLVCIAELEEIKVCVYPWLPPSSNQTLLRICKAWTTWVLFKARQEEYLHCASFLQIPARRSALFHMVHCYCFFRVSEASLLSTIVCMFVIKSLLWLTFTVLLRHSHKLDLLNSIPSWPPRSCAACWKEESVWLGSCMSKEVNRLLADQVFRLFLV